MRAHESPLWAISMIFSNAVQNCGHTKAHVEQYLHVVLWHDAVQKWAHESPLVATYSCFFVKQPSICFVCARILLVNCLDAEILLKFWHKHFLFVHNIFDLSLLWHHQRERPNDLPLHWQDILVTPSALVRENRSFWYSKAESATACWMLLILHQQHVHHCNLQFTLRHRRCSHLWLRVVSYRFSTRTVLVSKNEVHFLILLEIDSKDESCSRNLPTSKGDGGKSSSRIRSKIWHCILLVATSCFVVTYTWHIYGSEKWSLAR